MPAPKIATCCYCGTRAVLQLRGQERHELACAQCGAPLHDLKQMPLDRDRVTAPRATPTRPAPKPTHPRMEAKGKRQKKKKKTLRRKMFEELWDAVEDIFD